MIERVKDIGAVLGFISTAIALFALIKTRVLSTTKNYVERESGKAESEKADAELKAELVDLKEQMVAMIESNTKFQDEMREHNAVQDKVSKRLLADLIETTYNQNKDTRCLTHHELKRIIEAYALYSSPPINGNSYIQELYKEMHDTWDRI